MFINNLVAMYFILLAWCRRRELVLRMFIVAMVISMVEGLLMLVKVGVKGRNWNVDWG